MMESLGHADTMPNVTRLERNDVYQQQRRNLAASIDGTDSTAQLIQTYGTGSKAEIAKALEKNEAHKKDLQKQLNDVNAKIADNNKGQVIPGDIPGPKTLICTLVAPDSPAGKWMDTYVHSKIMVIDDVFLTHGSANINTRSMEVDSELNICHEHGDVSRALRKRLWAIHTKPAPSEGQGAASGNDVNSAAIGDNMTDAFNQWVKITDRNKRLRGSNLQPLAALVSFSSNTTTRSRLD
ncbi:phospholipase D-like domain-containing protein [Burkholderia sp. AU39826]|uniref:phospholipase D-like domain-containing protein n=1 Tax=Burkholderia sp. AU39826 TaxID=2879634 RepID=UPI001CF19EDB|nr:phospholipase D-like domain-containing protein [Burkholderia sp. AU39826]MCA7971147.1 phospholipase D-like domain-containing protein [Burkholderia sp. AU39826]